VENAMKMKLLAMSPSGHKRRLDYIGSRSAYPPIAINLARPATDAKGHDASAERL
jgi:hypothetical protein